METVGMNMLRKLMVVIIALGSVSVAQADPIRFMNSYYDLTSTPLNWTGARAEALALDPDAPDYTLGELVFQIPDAKFDLVTINTVEEQTWLAATFSGLHWIGFNDIQSESIWVWGSAQNVSYTNWCSGQPDGDTRSGQDAAIINAGPNGCWDDVRYNSISSPLYLGIVEWSVVPEPGTLGLFGIGLLALLFRRRKVSRNVHSMSS